MELQEFDQQRCKDIERSIIKKFRAELWSQFTKAINTYDLIQDGDKIAVCISGGKDSMLLAKLFQELARHGKHNFEVVFLAMNPGYSDANYQNILRNAELTQCYGLAYHGWQYSLVAKITGSEIRLCVLTSCTIH